MLISGMLATQAQVGSNLPGRAQAQVGKILSGLNGATPRTSSTKTQKIGGGTTQAEEKMTKMVSGKILSQELCEQAP